MAGWGTRGPVTGLLRPRALRPGDTVAVAALSGGLEEGEAQAYEDGVRELRRAGFVVQVSPLVELGRHDWWSAARPAEIAAELNRLLADPQVRAVFALTGGRTTFSYLDLVDLDAVRADPKPIVGFSDIGGLRPRAPRPHRPRVGLRRSRQPRVRLPPRAAGDPSGRPSHSITRRVLMEPAGPIRLPSGDAWNAGGRAARRGRSSVAC